MANRSVVTKLILDLSKWLPEGEKAAKVPDKIKDAAERSAAKNAQAWDKIGKASAGAATAGATAMFGLVHASLDFDKSMSGVAAVSNSSADELRALRQAALQAGADTSFSASQAADAEAELAKAGVSTSDILGGALTGSLGLAAAGQLDLADAATISAQAMNIWKLKGSDVAHIADTLAAGANKSAADVSDLGLAMQQGGLVAAQMGVGMEETIGTLSAFADRALRGSDAGTSLKTMLQRLASPSAEASAMMQKLGIHTFDETGKFIGLAGVAGQLHDKLGTLTQEQRNMALSTIFGSDAIRAASVLMENGKAGIQDYTKAVNDQGAAGRMAGTQMDNLSGDIEALRGSIETVLIKGGTGATTVLRGVTHVATDLVNVVGDLPGPLQATAVGLVAVGTGGTAAIAMLGSVVPKIKAGREALAGMGTVGARADQVLGRVGKGVGASIPILGVAAAAWEVYSSKQREAQQHVEDLTQAIKDDSGALGEHTRATVVDSLEQQGALRAAQDMGLSTRDLTDAVFGNVDAQRKLGEALRSGKGDRAAVIGAYTSETKALKDGKDAALRKSEAEETTAGKTKEHGAAAQGTTTDLNDERSATDKLNDSIDQLNKTITGAATTNLDFLDSLDKVRGSIKDNGRAFGVTNQKTRDNERAVIAAVKAAQDHAAAVTSQTGSIERGNAVFATHVRELRAVLTAAHVSKAEIDRLIATYARVPTNVTTNVRANTGQAEQALNRVQNSIRRIKQQDGTTVTVRVVDQTLYVGGRPAGRAEGGWLRGGVAGRDSIPLANGDMGMPGEFVVNRKSAQKYGPLLEAINDGQVGAYRPAHPPAAAYRPAAPAAAPARVELRISSGGTRLDRVLVDVLRGAIIDLGGDVQFSLGSR